MPLHPGARLGPYPIKSVVYVRPLSASGPPIALMDSGEFPVFLRDGRTLALVRGRQLVVRFLALVRTEDAPPPRIRVVLGWDRELARMESGNLQ